MSKGFLTLAQNGKYDYVKMAYVLAMSLAISQDKHPRLSVMVNDDEEIPEKYSKWFDNIIKVETTKEDWKVHNKWKFFELTPYDETIVIDTDMLFFHDITTWWDILSDYDLSFTTQVKNYRNNIVTSDFYRKVFTKNSLPNLYTGLFYFKKTKTIEKYFNFLRIIFENWKEFYNRLLTNPPTYLSGDVAYALAARIFFNRNWANISNILTFTHMRSRLQDDSIFEWPKVLHTFFSTNHNKVYLKVNNFNQLWPFHYIKKNFLTDEVIELYEQQTLRLL